MACNQFKTVHIQQKRCPVLIQTQITVKLQFDAKEHRILIYESKSETEKLIEAKCRLNIPAEELSD